MTRAAPLHLEFIQRRRVPWGGFGFLAFSLLLSAVVAAKWVNLNANHLQYQERLSRLELSLKERQRTAAQNRSLSDPAAEQRLKNQTAINAALLYPWNSVLSTIEQPDVKDIAILSFAHDQSTKNTQLSVEALNVPALIQFVDQMNEGLESKSWYIASYQPQPQNNPPTVRASILNK